MTALLRAEGRKLLSTRSWMVMVVVVIVYPVLTIVAVNAARESTLADPETLVRFMRGGSVVVAGVALLLGILATAGEYHHGTIVPALLVVPRRSRMLAAKLGGQATLGVALGVAVNAVGLAVGVAYLAANDISVNPLSSAVLLTLGGGVLVTVMYALIGTAIGALVRNQTAAVAGSLIWLLAIENVLPVVLRNPGLRRWFPGDAAGRLLYLVDPLPGMGSAWTALAMLCGLAATLTVAAVAATRRADIN